MLNAFFFDSYNQGWGAGAGRSRVFLAAWSRSRLKKKPGAGAAKKFAGSPALVIISIYGEKKTSRGNIFSISTITRKRGEFLSYKIILSFCYLVVPLISFLRNIP